MNRIAKTVNSISKKFGYRLIKIEKNDWSEEFVGITKSEKSILEVCSKYSMTGFERMYFLIKAIEHIKYDKKELERLSKNLNKNGHILITVPAYKFLFSIKDKILGHHRRYNKSQISKLFKNFDTIKLTYFNFFLFIPISLIIIFYKILHINFIKKVESSPNFFVNKILFSIFMIEKKLIQFLDLPFGISLLGLFKKK